MIMTEILNIKEAAQLTRLKVSTIYFYCESGRIPYLKVGARVLFRRDDLLGWLLSHRRDPIASVR